MCFPEFMERREIDGYMLAVWTEEHYPQIKIILTSGYRKAKRKPIEDKARRFLLIKELFYREACRENHSGIFC
jgi:hypothetical protein